MESPRADMIHDMTDINSIRLQFKQNLHGKVAFDKFERTRNHMTTDKLVVWHSTNFTIIL